VVVHLTQGVIPKRGCYCLNPAPSQVTEMFYGATKNVVLTLGTVEVLISNYRK
jgi:hypothetical protein